MGRIPEKLRHIIAANIRAERMKKFPGRGGGKKCAEAFGVSPQQWSPWERAMRTPDELRLSQIADFFGVSVEYMRRDHAPPESKPADAPHFPEPSLHALPRAEDAIIGQFKKEFSTSASDEMRIRISVNIVVSKEMP